MELKPPGLLEEGGSLTVLGLVVGGSGRSQVLVKPEQGEEREERLSMTDQDGGGLRQLLRRPEGHDL